MHRFALSLLVPMLCLQLYAGDAYQNDFEKAEVGKSAGDLEFLVIGDGDFKVVAEEKGKALELAPTPLETYGCLFGPTEVEDVEVQITAHGTLSGRRFPVFGVGLSGVGGYLFRVNPSKKNLELLKGEDVKVAVPYAWKSGTWTNVRLSVKKVKDGQWTVTGKAWERGQEEPKDPQVKFDDSEKPLSGRASFWGIPYASTPIRFDDLSVRKL